MESILFSHAKIALTIGFIGTASYLIAYLLLSLNKIKANQMLYHWLNIVGAIGLIVNAAYLNDYPSLLVNIIWTVIAVMAIILIWRKRRR